MRSFDVDPRSCIMMELMKEVNGSITRGRETDRGLGEGGWIAMSLIIQVRPRLGGLFRAVVMWQYSTTKSVCLDGQLIL